MNEFRANKRSTIRKSFSVALLALMLVLAASAQDSAGTPNAPQTLPRYKDYVPCFFNYETKDKTKEADSKTPRSGRFEPTKDIVCSFSLLQFNEASDIFGKRIAKTYGVIQVVVRNLNQKNDFLLHDVLVRVPLPDDPTNPQKTDPALVGVNSEYRAGRDKLLARGVTIVGQSKDPRNMIMGSLDTLAATAGAISLIGAAATPVSAAFSGLSNGTNVLTAFLPPLKRLFPDYTIDQLNRLNDLGFSASSNYKIIVPKGGAIPFVTFVPQELFPIKVKNWKTDDFVKYDNTTSVLVAGALIQELTNAPSVSALSLTSGPPGTPVTITGTNFGEPQGSSVVKIGGKPIPTESVTSWNAASIGITIPSDTPAGATSVVVSVNNTIDSAALTFTVGDPPKITTQPISATVTSGHTATFSVNATGNAPLNYQWYKGASGDTTTPVDGATASSYTTPPITGNVSYWVQVSNTFGGSPHTANSSTATVTVGDLPDITTQPVGATVTSGQTATLSVIATGTTPLSYQWYQGVSGDTTTPVGGATASNFTTPQITVNTSYWVRVSNTFGGSPHTKDSTTATLTVGAIPTIAPLTGATITSGQTVTLSVVATGTASLSYQWYQGVSGDTTTPVGGATSSTFTTRAITANTSYWVRVKNTFGGSDHTADSTTANITVH